MIITTNPSWWWRRLLVACLVGAVLVAGMPGPAAGELIPYFRLESRQKRWGYADSTGRLVIAPQYEAATRFRDDGLAEVRRQGLWGMIDAQGREVIPLRYRRLFPFSDGLALAALDTGQPVPGVQELGPGPGQRTPVTRTVHGFLDRQGQVAIPFQYGWAHPFRDGVAPVSQSRPSPHCLATDGGRAVLWGLIDTRGRTILQIEHCLVTPADNGWVRVEYEKRGPNEARVGYVDREGRVLIPKLPYDWAATRWSEGYLMVRQQGRWGFIDRSGREVIPPRFQEVSSFFDGRARARQDGRWGYIDPTGTVKIPFQYEDAGEFDQGLACVRIGDRSGFIDRDGRLQIPARFDWSWSCDRPFTEGLRATPQGGKWGYIDRAGAFVIPPRFDEAWGFSEGLAAVRLDGLWGFVDRTGRLAIPARYFRVDNGFVRGLAYVTTRQPDPCCQGIYKFAEGLIDHQGREFFDAP